MAKKNEISYAQALEELHTLVQDLENDQISVDELSAKVKRAALLLELCREKLRNTNDEIKQIMNRLQGKEEE